MAMTDRWADKEKKRKKRKKEKKKKEKKKKERKKEEKKNEKKKTKIIFAPLPPPPWRRHCMKPILEYI